ncbi:unnamed protein product [Rotaria magnacalcarata]|uniref:Uncharacterized protein n=1 Tax=Rotaria magnacalcarata TaxID=392030 RepID=A0A815MUH7_9BILA|nr:unnamed protein product [Rotaria magnacalcarata]CAF1686462.1 unnamed protein product [Rotaria magnacalcarata]CAF2102269.1 unnamed protein product [Rotaria magnacalcarata]CAF3796694.1 unnamed protein product [Rotaria magnacalcarata]CAF3808131.1 unnamed protein product [Rotaria magnacalcarata]
MGCLTSCLLCCSPCCLHCCPPCCSRCCPSCCVQCCLPCCSLSDSSLSRSDLSPDDEFALQRLTDDGISRVVNLQPLKKGDYRNDPPVTLREALKSIKLPIDPSHIEEAEKKCRWKPGDLLTRDESASIYIYTMHKTKNEIYTPLRKALQHGDRSALLPWLPYLRLMESACNKLPPAQGIRYRAIKKTENKNNHKNLRQNEQMMSSWTESENRLLRNGWDIIEDVNVPGVDIRGYTASKKWAETLVFADIKLLERPTSASTTTTNKKAVSAIPSGSKCETQCKC